MNSKINKTGFILLVMAGLFLTNAGFVEAVGWDPITDLSSFGIAADETVSLDNFIIILYDFLLSAVGIAAMFMIIVGGFRYLTAAGNAAALSEAKDIIYSALYGLLLAICVFVIVSTINPDLVYLKKPGTTVNNPNYSCISQKATCNTCAGGDGCSAAVCAPVDPDCDPISPPMAIANCCHGTCNAASNGVCPKKISCLESATSSEGGNINGDCECADKTDIAIVPNQDCSITCKNAGHCHKAGLLVGVIDGTRGIFTSQEERAIAYATHTGSEASPYIVPHDCLMAFNAKDRTVDSDDVISYIIDITADGPATVLDLSFPPIGYAAADPTLPTCYLDFYYEFWRNNAMSGGKCKKVDDEGVSQSVICPMELTVTYNGGGFSKDVVWIKMIATNCIADGSACRDDGDDAFCCSGDCFNHNVLGWICKWW